MITPPKRGNPRVKGFCGCCAGSRPRAPHRRGAAFPALRDSSGAADGAIWVVPRIFPSHRGGEVLFFLHILRFCFNIRESSFRLKTGHRAGKFIGKIKIFGKVSIQRETFGLICGYYGRTFSYVPNNSPGYCRNRILFMKQNKADLRQEWSRKGNEMDRTQ